MGSHLSCHLLKPPLVSRLSFGNPFKLALCPFDMSSAFFEDLLALGALNDFAVSSYAFFFGLVPAVSHLSKEPRFLLEENSP